MPILTLLVGHDDGTIESYFGVEHEGNLWLVTAWLINRASQTATPERMIRIDRGNFQKADPGVYDYINIVLPKSVIEGLSEESPGFEVRSLPAAPIVDARQLRPLPGP